jgi:hypothetical protein
MGLLPCPQWAHPHTGISFAAGCAHLRRDCPAAHIIVHSIGTAGVATHTFGSTHSGYSGYSLWVLTPWVLLGYSGYSGYLLRVLRVLLGYSVCSLGARRGNSGVFRLFLMKPESADGVADGEPLILTAESKAAPKSRPF